MQKNIPSGSGELGFTAEVIGQMVGAKRNQKMKYLWRSDTEEPRRRGGGYQRLCGQPWMIAETERDEKASEPRKTLSLLIPLERGERKQTMGSVRI